MSASRIGAVIRVGWIENGKVVEDKVLRPNQSLFVGEGPRSNLNIPGMPGRLLLEVRGGEYVLVSGEGLQGKVEVNGKELKLGEKDPLVMPVGAKGKLIFEKGNLLFQVMPAPVVAPAMVTRDESLFDGLLLMYGAMAVVFSLWVQSQPVREEMSLEEVATMVNLAEIPRVEIPIVKPEKKIDQLAGRDAPRTQPRSAPSTPTQNLNAPQSAGQMVDSIAKKLDVGGLLANDGQVADQFGKIRSIGADGPVQVGFHLGPTVQLDDAVVKIGGAGGPAGGGKPGVEGSVVVRKPLIEVDKEDTTVSGPDDPQAVLKVIQSKRGGVEGCASAALKGNPSLKVRLSARWSIQDGRVVGAGLTHESTDKDLNTCMLSTVKSMRFAPGTEADEVTYTWLIQGQ